MTMTELQARAQEGFPVYLTGPLLREAVADAWLRADMLHDRNWQTDPGISSVFACQRQVAYQYAGTKPSDPPRSGSRLNRQATLGTWIHEHFLPLLADALGAAVVEVEVFADFVRGHLDLAGTTYVIDLKTCSTAKLSRVRNQGPSKRNRGQTMLYARARRDAGYRVDRVGLVFLDRENGEDYCWVEDYDPNLVEEALIWFHEAKTGNPEYMPRGGKGPGLDFMCDDCPFRTLCWPDGQATLRTEVVNQDAAIESALAMYRNEADAESQAEGSKKFAGAILAGLPKGQYGDWKLTWGFSGRRLDQRAATQILEDLGIEVPRTEGSHYPKVTRAKASGED